MEETRRGDAKMVSKPSGRVVVFVISEANRRNPHFGYHGSHRLSIPSLAHDPAPFPQNIPSCLFFCDCRMDTGCPCARSMQPYSTTQSAMFTSPTPILTSPFGPSSDLLYLSQPACHGCSTSLGARKRTKSFCPNTYGLM